ncbi:hypothetical protein L599_001200000520 [Luteimonas sp. J16]|jgi:hypothetical protein|uniref:hypothetical protein n=1 Tax=unclassified Luteimonas TaxID=2629088 RepID=UPI0004794023|nr:MULTISPECIES: hypothetical protein [unclassified Luteimonas]TWG93592.1 hypothetical protein L599_001200000520 [Luteimonas sp. J16]
MAKDANADELVDQLRDQFNKQIQDTIRGLPPYQSLQLADSLCRIQLDVLAGTRVLFKAKRKVDREAVIEAWRKGATIETLMRDFNISQSYAYEILPAKSRRKRRQQRGGG